MNIQVDALVAYSTQAMITDVTLQQGCLHGARLRLTAQWTERAGMFTAAMFASLLPVSRRNHSLGAASNQSINLDVHVAPSVLACFPNGLFCFSTVPP